MSARTIRLSDNSSWRLSLGLQFCHPTNYRRVDEYQMALLKNGLGWWSFNSERNFQAYVGKVHAILERIWDLFIYALNVGKKKERVEGKEGSTSPQSTNMGEKTKSVREGRGHSSSCCFLDVNSGTFCPHSFLLEGERRSSWGIKISPCIMSVSFCASEWQTSSLDDIPVILKMSYNISESCFLNFVFIFVCGPVQEVVVK